MKQRKKAFVGAIIGAVGSVANLAGNLINAKKQKEAEELEFEQKQKQLNEQIASQNAQALTQSMVDQSYVDAYKNKLTLRNGGKMKTTYKDRIDRDKKLACSGRNKAACGTKKKACGGRKKAELGTVADVASGVGGAIGGIGNLIGALTKKVEAPKTLQTPSTFDVQAHKTIVPNSYPATARCGMKKKKR